MNKLQQAIIQSILSSNLYIGNSKVSNLEELAMVEYSEENRKLLKQILKNGEYEKLSGLIPPKDLLGAELTVVRFMNESNKVYYGIYYDSIDLFQEPEILEIFPST